MINNLLYKQTKLSMFALKSFNLARLNFLYFIKATILTFKSFGGFFMNTIVGFVATIMLWMLTPFLLLITFISGAKHDK